MHEVEVQRFSCMYGKKNIASRFCVKHTDFILSLNTIYFRTSLISVKTFEATVLPIISSDAEASVICNLRKHLSWKLL